MLWLLGVLFGRVCGESLHLGCWLLMWLSGSSGFCRCWMRLCDFLWLGGCLGWFREVTSGRLRAFDWKLLPRPLFGWHFVGVLSKSQTVGTNVGVRQLEAIKFQREREMTHNEKRKMAWISMQIVVNQYPPHRVPVRVNL
jgi:hypothetical protein